MSVANAFYVTVTIDEVEPQRYVEVARALATAMQTITSTKLAEFTKPHLTKPRCEVEVGVASVEGSTYTVQANIVIQAYASKSFTLDKNKLTTLLKNEVPYPLKLSKRSVDRVELEAVLSAQEDDGSLSSKSMTSSAESSEMSVSN